MLRRPPRAVEATWTSRVPSLRVVDMARFDPNWLLCPIWGALGTVGMAGVEGCGGKVETPTGALPDGVSAQPDEASSAAGAGDSGGASSDGSGGSGGVTANGAGGTGGSEPQVAVWDWRTGDMPSGKALPEPTTCHGIEGALLAFPEETSFNLSRADAETFCGEPFAEDYVRQGACLPAPPLGQTCAEAYPLSEIAGTWDCGHDDLATLVCGAREPEPGSLSCTGNECCYVIAGGCAVGRPFIVQGEARRAGLVARADWRGGSGVGGGPDVSLIDPQTRRALADVYAEDALTEHASIASFARFVLECLALGAPADIVHEAARALADEIAHAEQSFALASAYAGASLGPSGLDVSGALGEALTLRESAVRTLREGCIAETVSAALIHAAAEAAEDACTKATLSRVAEDERRHAVLAWRFVSWAVRREGEPLLAMLRAEVQRAREHVGFGAFTELRGEARVMRAHGYLPENERRTVAAHTLDEVVLPAARALEQRGPAALALHRERSSAGSASPSSLAASPTTSPASSL